VAFSVSGYRLGLLPITCIKITRQIAKSTKGNESLVAEPHHGVLMVLTKEIDSVSGVAVIEKYHNGHRARDLIHEAVLLSALVIALRRIVRVAEDEEAHDQSQHPQNYNSGSLGFVSNYFGSVSRVHAVDPLEERN